MPILLKHFCYRVDYKKYIARTWYSTKVDLTVTWYEMPVTLWENQDFNFRLKTDRNNPAETNIQACCWPQIILLGEAFILDRSGKLQRVQMMKLTFRFADGLKLSCQMKPLFG